ncbi:thioredoxin family protein [Polaribacter sp.]|jgi:thioredoxin-related protein|uniref:thioredoxin family protein n=1 Tax=Polaribacter sp. TaxID=1920175 RepID=UPI004048E831
MKNIYLIIFLNSILNFAQESKKLTIYTFEEVEKLHQKNPRPHLFFIYTDWCKICFGMKNTTFQNEQIIEILNSDFYVVFLNAETKKEITFFGKSFKNTTNGIHDLAITLASKNKQIEYPTTVIVNKDLSIELQFQGFLKSTKLKSVLEPFLMKNNK